MKNVIFVLNQILEKDEYTFFQYVSLIVQLFIVTSISVSYMTMGSALHHTSEIICLYKFNEYIIYLLVKGVVDSYWNITLEAETNLTRYGPVFRYVTIRR
jgi:hypothetical protein